VTDVSSHLLLEKVVDPRSVLFPEPLTPMMAMVSPGMTKRLTPV
jgi:hypothetical protein